MLFLSVTYIPAVFRPNLGCEVAFVVRFDVVPLLLFYLVVGRPHEGRIVILVDHLDGAVGDLLVLGLVQNAVGVSPALAVFDQGLVVIPLIRTEGSIFVYARINLAVASIRTLWAIIVRFRTFNLLALSLSLRGRIVEAEQPVRAVVRREGPLAHPDLHFAGQIHREIVIGLIGGAEIFRWQDACLLVVPEGHVSVPVHRNFVPVTVSKKLWPHRVSWSETVMEHEIGMR